MGLLSVMVLLTLFPLRGIGQEVSILEGRRITLYYPTLVTQECAELFLERQEQALAFVEECLGVTCERQIAVLVEEDLFGWRGAGGRETATYYFSGPQLQYLAQAPAEALGEFNLGCHELVHVVAVNELAPFALESTHVV